MNNSECTCKHDSPKTATLPKVGDRISWFGTKHIVHAVNPPNQVAVILGNGEVSNLHWSGGPGNVIIRTDRPYVTDGGCSTITGLKDRCSTFLAVYGAGHVFNHPEGFVYESNNGERVLVVLPQAPA